MRTLLITLAWVTGGLLGLATAFLLAFRLRFTPVLDAIRQMNKRVSNPRQLRSAGEPGAYAGIVEHVGRRSATPYRTPVGIHRDGDELLVVLPYGPEVDWVRNLLAAGGGRVHHEGDALDVTEPRVVATAAVRDRLGSGDRRTTRLFGIDHALLLRIAPGDREQ